ncbi:MAG: hypothetical protein SPL21_10010 [Fibrobacter sp.]|nr:hypothetical protein [Fibrobacter sp.]
MNIILSIKPQWAKLIYENKKILEWRKTLPGKMDLKLLRDGNPNVKVYLYETAPIKAITGFFYWGGVKICDARNMTEDTKGLVPIKDLKAYQGENCSLCAWIIDRPTKLHKKCSIQEFNLNRPPQSWCYTKKNLTTWKRYLEDKENT